MSNNNSNCGIINGNNQQNVNILNSEIIDKLNQLHENVLHTGKVTITDLQDAYKQYLESTTTTTTIGTDQLTSSRIQNGTSSTLHSNTGNGVGGGDIGGNGTTTSLPGRINLVFTFGFLVFIMILTPIVCEVIQFLLGVRCFVPNNYLVWEATRPVSDCGFCQSVRAPLILKNLTRDEFAPFAYSSRPIIIKNAVSHWPAIKKLNFTYLKNLYESIPGALDEDCQFLHFRSEFMSLRDVFKMSNERATYNEHEHNDDEDDDDADDGDHNGHNNNGGHKPWYVGWSNCHPIVLEELRKLYPRPHFLPEDAEMPNTDYIFLGYEQGAIMHLDYIPRLMWQAQLQGNKSWILAPAPECDQICHSFEFYVEPGDAVLIDTRIWYHGTSIPKGQFALTIQSEYG